MKEVTNPALRKRIGIDLERIYSFQNTLEKMVNILHHISQAEISYVTIRTISKIEQMEEEEVELLLNALGYIYDEECQLFELDIAIEGVELVLNNQSVDLKLHKELELAKQHLYGTLRAVETEAKQLKQVEESLLSSLSSLKHVWKHAYLVLHTQDPNYFREDPYWSLKIHEFLANDSWVEDPWKHRPFEG
jgi:transcriptional regulator with XRE-family HTH domain